MHDGHLVDAMSADSAKALPHAPRGIGHGLIGVGTALLLLGLFLADGIAWHPVVLLDDVAHIDARPGDPFEMKVPSPGNYDLYSAVRNAERVSGTERFRDASGTYHDDPGAPAREYPLPDEAKAWYAHTRAVAGPDGTWIVQSPPWQYPKAMNETGRMWAVPSIDPPHGVDTPTLVRDVFIALVGATMLIIGLVMRRRFVRSVRQRAEEIEASLGPAPGKNAQ